MSPKPGPVHTHLHTIFTSVSHSDFTSLISPLASILISFARLSASAFLSPCMSLSCLSVYHLLSACAFGNSPFCFGLGLELSLCCRVGSLITAVCSWVLIAFFSSSSMNQELQKEACYQAIGIG